MGSALLDLLFPPRCPFCRRLLTERHALLCPDCQRTLPWLEGDSARRTGEFFGVCVSPLAYRGPVREAVHRYKFSGSRSYARMTTFMTRLAFMLILLSPLARKSAAPAL